MVSASGTGIAVLDTKGVVRMIDVEVVEETTETEIYSTTVVDAANGANGASAADAVGERTEMVVLVGEGMNGNEAHHHHPRKKSLHPTSRISYLSRSESAASHNGTSNRQDTRMSRQSKPSSRACFLSPAHRDNSPWTPLVYKPS